MITSSHPLYHARLKSDRAKVHLSSLKSNITKFKNDPRPLQRIIEEDGQKRLHTQWPRPIPDSWGLILSDFATNLRASLDYIAWQLASKHIRDTGKSRDPNGRTQFPICDSTESYRTQGRRRIDDILPCAIPEIERVQPYNRANWPETHLLSVLRELAGKTKHRFVIPPDSYVQLRTPASGMTAIMMPLNKPEVIVQTSGERPTPYTSLNPDVSMQISFETPAISPSTHDITVLEGIHQFVSKEIIPRFSRFF